MEKQKRNNARRFASLFVVVVVIVMIINLACPDKTYGYAENRTLNQFPSITTNTVISGNTGSDLETWYNDQFAGRNFILHADYLLKKATGIREIDGVYLAKKCLIQNPSQPDPTALDRNINAINNFRNTRDLETYFMLAPTAACIDQDKLPAFATVVDESAQITQIQTRLQENVIKTNVMPILKSHADEYLYYKTDHHWTSLGAYYGLTSLLNAMDTANPALNTFEILPVSTTFEGTLASKTGSVGLKDTIDIYVSQDDPEYIVTTSDGISTSVYDRAALDQKNQYEVFLGGNCPLVKIEINNSESRHLLLFKDSYANALIPFLLPYFRTITIIDPRYYYDDLNTLISTTVIDTVLYCYNYDNFVTDTSLADVLEGAIAAGQMEQ